MKAQILKHLRTRWAKTNKAIPVGLDAVELDKRAEIIASGLQKSGYDGPIDANLINLIEACLLYTSPSPRDRLLSRMPSSA